MKSAEQETKIQKVQTTDYNEKISGLSKISSKKMKTNHGNNNNNNNINNNINNNDGEENEAQGHKFSWKDRLAANKNILSLASPALIDKIGGETQNPSSNVLVNSESAVAETEIISRVTGMFSYGSPHQRDTSKHPRYGSIPYGELPPPYKL